MGIISLLLVCCGVSYVFGALGIVFAILSRTAGKKMDPQASIGLGLSIAGSVIGIIVLIVYLVGNFAYIATSIENYGQFYNGGYYDNYEDDFEDYFDNYGNSGNYEDYLEDYFDHYGDDVSWDPGSAAIRQPLETASGNMYCETYFCHSGHNVI